MATQQEVLEIVTEFMLNAPPGEFLDVVHDIRRLISDERLLNATALPTFREYNLENMLRVVVPVLDSKDESYPVLITREGELSDKEFIDHCGKQVLLFDHLRQQATGFRPIRSGDTNDEGEPLRAALNLALDEYVAQHFPLGAGGVFCPVRGAKPKEPKYVVCISCGDYQPNNFWSGLWRSRWEFVCPSAGGPLRLEGSVKLCVHFYEDGNVEMKCDCPLQVTISMPTGSLEETGAQIIKAITQAEAEFQQRLNRSYETMSDTTFKALRRILPITRSKVDWMKLPNYKMGSDISDYTTD
jgi:capping protein alpha